MNSGQGRGFGFRGAAPAWPYVGRGRGGLPRCAAPELQRGAAYQAPAFAGGGTGELGSLKDRAAAFKTELDAIEKRIGELEKKEA